MADVDKYRVSMAAARINVKLTQSQVASALQVCEKTVKNWESGKSIPRSDNLKAFCALCKCSVDDIRL